MCRKLIQHGWLYKLSQLHTLLLNCSRQAISIRVKTYHKVLERMTTYCRSRYYHKMTCIQQKQIIWIIVYNCMCLSLILLVLLHMHTLILSEILLAAWYLDWRLHRTFIIRILVWILLPHLRSLVAVKIVFPCFLARSNSAVPASFLSCIQIKPAFHITSESSTDFIFLIFCVHFRLLVSLLESLVIIHRCWI